MHSEHLKQCLRECERLVRLIYARLGLIHLLLG